MQTTNKNTEKDRQTDQTDNKKAAHSTADTPARTHLANANGWVGLLQQLFKLKAPRQIAD
jgi:hypothetical protein